MFMALALGGPSAQVLKLLYSGPRLINFVGGSNIKFACSSMFMVHFLAFKSSGAWQGEHVQNLNFVHTLGVTSSQSSAVSELGVTHTRQCRVSTDLTEQISRIFQEGF